MKAADEVHGPDIISVRGEYYLATAAANAVYPIFVPVRRYRCIEGCGHGRRAGQGRAAYASGQRESLPPSCKTVARLRNNPIDAVLEAMINRCAMNDMTVPPCKLIVVEVMT
jgi:hypothetical protein